jgi:hypothetical protein
MYPVGGGGAHAEPCGELGVCMTAPQMGQNQRCLPSRGQPSPSRALLAATCGQFTSEESQGRGGQIGAGWVDKHAEAPGRTAWTRHSPVYQELPYLRTPPLPPTTVLSRQVGKGSVRDNIIDINPARVIGWQQEYKRAEDELDDPRSLALPDWAALDELASALVARSSDEYEGWGDVVCFAACTATRIGDVSGVRAGDIDPETWMWNVCRQTTTGPGGLIDKGTKGKRRRTVPIIPGDPGPGRPAARCRWARPEGPADYRTTRRPDLHRRSSRRHPLG